MYLKTERGDIINLDKVALIRVCQRWEYTESDASDTHEVIACLDQPNYSERLFKGTESDCNEYQTWLLEHLVLMDAQVIPNDFAPRPPVEAPNATKETFTYTDRRGRQQTIALDVNALLDARREGAYWYDNPQTRVTGEEADTMRNRFGVACSVYRLREIRESIEWWHAVKAYAKANNLMTSKFFLDCLPDNRKWRYNDEQVENR